jgi:hypothetical protein
MSARERALPEVVVRDCGTLLYVKPQRISWSFVLPFAELALWSALVVIPTLLMYGEFYSLHRHENTSTSSAQFDLIVSRGGWLEFSLATVCERRFHTIVNLNLPGALIGAPLTAPVASYFRRNPSAFSVQTWHAVTIPFFCLPAWWFVGLGMEGVLTRKRLNWALRSVGSTLCCACIALAIGILTSPPADSADLLPFIPGAIFWAVAFGLFPVNWLVTARPRNNPDVQKNQLNLD